MLPGNVIAMNTENNVGNRNHNLKKETYQLILLIMCSMSNACDYDRNVMTRCICNGHSMRCRCKHQSKFYLIIKWLANGISFFAVLEMVCVQQSNPFYSDYALCRIFEHHCQLWRFCGTQFKKEVK